MTIRIVCLTYILFLLSCLQEHQAQVSKLVGVTLSLNWDLEKTKSFADTYSDNIEIIYLDSLIMLHDWVRKVQFNERSSHDAGDTIHIKQLITMDTTRTDSFDRYFVYNSESGSGRLYFSLRNAESWIFNVDSLLQARALKGAVFYNDNDSLVNTEKRVGEYDILQSYIPKSRPDASYPDTTNMYFSESLKHIPYSFSSALDNKMKMKLAKVIFVYNPGIDVKGNKTDGRKMSFEIKRAEIKDPGKILALFERYKKETN